MHCHIKILAKLYNHLAARIDDMELFGKKISGPFTIGSGIVTTNIGIIAKFAREIPQVGVLTTKSIGLAPKPGNIEPIFADLPEKNTFINAVGLGNPGFEAFRAEAEKIYPLKNRFLLVSIFDSSPEGLVKIAKGLEGIADGFELNFSCPHAEKGYGIHIGTSCELTGRYTKKLKDQVSKPIIVKMTPNVENYSEIVEGALNAGADGITAINTIGPADNEVLSHGKGGVSGSFVKPRALECVKITREVADRLGKKIPIIGMGGIMDADDVRQFRDAGATIFGVGSALTGLDTSSIKKYFAAMDKDLQGNQNSCASIVIKQKLMQYSPFKITEIRQVDHDLKIFYFDRAIPHARPGHYVFAWLKGVAEKPFSLAHNNPVMLVVRAVGPFTKKMFELKVGGTVMMRGPYGTAYPEMKDSVLVGGGTGVAPLFFLASQQLPSAVFIGGRTANQLLLKDEFSKICMTFVSTDDGSEGFKGYVTDLLAGKLKSGLKIRSFSTAGPEIMMRKAADIAANYLPEDKILLSTERYYKCGVGICGVCECNGYRTCIDGPIMTAASVAPDFGRVHRDKTGKVLHF